MIQDLQQWTEDKLRDLQGGWGMNHYLEKQLQTLQMGVKQYFPHRQQILHRIKRLRRYRQIAKMRQNQQKKQLVKRQLTQYLWYYFVYWYAQLLSISILLDFSQKTVKNSIEMEQQFLAFLICATTLINIVFQTVKQNFEDSQKFYILFLSKNPYISLKSYLATHKILPLVLQSLQGFFMLYFLFQFVGLSFEMIEQNENLTQYSLKNQIMLLPFLWMGLLLPFIIQKNRQLFKHQKK